MIRQRRASVRLCRFRTRTLPVHNRVFVYVQRGYSRVNDTRRNVLRLVSGAGFALAGAGIWRHASAADTINIGALYNLAGALASLDAPALKGSRLKVKELNDAGGVLGRPIELVVFDTRSERMAVASSATNLINRLKVPVALGFTDSDSALIAGPVFQKAGVPFVTPGATSPKLPDQIGWTLFLACFGDNVQAAAGA